MLMTIDIKKDRTVYPELGNPTRYQLWMQERFGSVVVAVCDRCEKSDKAYFESPAPLAIHMKFGGWAVYGAETLCDDCYGADCRKMEAYFEAIEAR